MSDGLEVLRARDVRLIYDMTAGTLPPSSQYENRPQILKVSFARLPSEDGGRADQLMMNGEQQSTIPPAVFLCTKLITLWLDELLASIIDLLPTPDYTVIYITSPRGEGTFPAVAENPSKESPKVQPDPILVQQKRKFARDGDDDVVNSNEPLFEKYQFLSAGTLPSQSFQNIEELSDRLIL